MNRPISTDAILLTKKAFGEGHMALCLLTSEFGMIRASAFGGQRLSKRFKGGIEYFQVFEAEIQRANGGDNQLLNLSCIKGVKKRYVSIPGMMEKYVATSYLQELSSMLLTPMDRGCGEHGTYFDLMSECLDRIDGATDREQVLDEVYETCVHFYRSTGFIPETSCAPGMNAKLCRLEHFNTSILERTPRSFYLLSEIYC